MKNSGINKGGREVDVAWMGRSRMEGRRGEEGGEGKVVKKRLNCVLHLYQLHTRNGNIMYTKHEIFNNENCN